MQTDCIKCKSDGPCDDTVVVASSISAGAIVGIAIGCAAAFGIFGAISGKAGYNAYLRNKDKMEGAQMSPLYHDNGLSGTNPFFEGGSAAPAAS